VCGRSVGPLSAQLLFAAGVQGQEGGDEIGCDAIQRRDDRQGVRAEESSALVEDCAQEYPHVLLVRYLAFAHIPFVLGDNYLLFVFDPPSHFACFPDLEHG